LQVSSPERAVNKARAAVRKAPAAGVPNELVTIKGGGHGQFAGCRTGRCLSEDPGLPVLSWPAAVGLTASLPALKLDFLIAIPSHDESVLRSPDIFDLRPWGRHRMEE
jgi:hypothetical protein